MISIRKSLNKNLLISMLVIMVLLMLVLNAGMHRLLTGYVLTRLQHDAESLIAVIDRDTQGRWFIPPQSVSSVYQRVRSGHYYRIIGPQQMLRSRSLFDFEFSLPDIAMSQVASYQMAGPGDEQWLVWQQAFSRQGERLQVWVAEDIDPLQDELNRYSAYTVFLLALTMIMLIVSHQRILKRAFHVFDLLRQNLQSIRQGQREQIGAPVPEEVEPLVREIEELVDQLQQRIQRTRKAIANLSHEIKRPLQLLSLNQPLADTEALQAVKDIQAIVDRELRRARVSGGAIPGGTIDLSQELPYLVEVMQKLYPAIRIDWEVSDKLAALSLDRDDVLELLGNLLDNAGKFADQRVVLRIFQQPYRLLIEVEDDGPGVSTDQLHLITQPGFRVDETVDGHGLGLGLCADIVRSYRGEMEFSTASLGGLKVRVSLPVAG